MMILEEKKKQREREMTRHGDGLALESSHQLAVVRE